MVVPSSYLRVSTEREVLTKSKPSQEDFWLQVREPTPRTDMTFSAAYIVDIAVQVFGYVTYDLS